MGRMILVEPSASLVGYGATALQVACAPEKEACRQASGVVGGSFVQVNVAPEVVYVVTFGPFEEVGGLTASDLPDTFLTAQGEAGREGAKTGREEGQSQDPVEGILSGVSGLVVHWGVLGRIGAYHCRGRAEVGPSHLGE